MARATRSEQTGSIGVSEATGKFGRIGFGFAEITRHDNGTDVFLMARDSRRFDLGLTMGAQIKGGQSWFREPKIDEEGNIAGWWFRDSDGSHIDDWLRHGLPHLLVMHDLESDVTYWVHVTADAVESTGRGKKILVPANQKVDEESREALIAIAASSRPAPMWEGSAWRGAESILEPDLLRYALLAPRLVAPHPNAHKEEPLEAAQSIAMVLQARLSELNELQERDLVPLVDQAAKDKDWMWQFYAALYRRVTTGDVDHLLEIRSAPTPAASAAAAVTAAACMMEEDRHGEAAEVLNQAIQADTAEPVDHAWLSIQLARAHAETGNVKESRLLAGSVQDIAATHSLDVTATAIAGSGAQLLFGLDPFVGNLGKTIEAADTAINWWRQQTRGWALGDALDRTFRSWTRANEFRWSSSDTANDQLVAASLNASLAGAQAEWRQLTGLLGKDKLIRLHRTARSEEVASGLSLLRLSGQSKALQHAVQRFTNDGPAVSVVDATGDIELSSLSHTSAESSLVLLRSAGAVLDENIANRTVEWLLSTLNDRAAFIERVRPNFWLDSLFVDTLSSVLQSATQHAHQLVADHIAAMPAVDDQFRTDSWVRVIQNLSEEVWSAEAAAEIELTAVDCERTLRDALWGVAAEYSDSARHSLLEAIRKGSQSALGAWGNVRSLPEEAVGDSIGYLVQHLSLRREQAVEGAITSWSYDQPRTLSILNCYYPYKAQWEPLMRYLEDYNVDSGEKAGALAILARMSKEYIPKDFHRRLMAVTDAIIRADRARQEVPFAELHPDAAGQAIFLKASLTTALEIDADFLQILAGDDRQRVWAARVASKQADGPSGPWTGMLLTLAHDENPSVRALAATGLSGLIGSHTRRSDNIAAVLDTLLDDGGLLVPLRVAERLASETEPSADARAILRRLQSHRIPSVRRAAEKGYTA